MAADLWPKVLKCLCPLRFGTLFWMELWFGSHQLKVILETEWEHRLLGRKMKDVGSVSVWTSGHICDGSVSERKGILFSEHLKYHWT